MPYSQEVIKILRLMPLAEKNLRCSGFIQEANFLKANEELMRDYFKFLTQPAEVAEFV